MRLAKLLKSIPWRVRCLLSSDHELTCFRLPQGIPVLYPIRSQIGYALYRGQFESVELNYALSVLRPGDAFIDIGANAGIFSLCASARVGPKGRIWAYEPGAREHLLLQLNLRLNHVSNVTVHRLGVSNREGDAEFVISADGAMNSLRRTQHPNQRPVDVAAIQTTTLTAILAQDEGRRIRLIKVDTEGAERQIILPAIAQLRERPEIRVLFESQNANNVGFGYSARQFLQELKDGGGHVSELRADGRLAPVRLDDPQVGEQIYNFVLTCSA